MALEPDYAKPVIATVSEPIKISFTKNKNPGNYVVTIAPKHNVYRVSTILSNTEKGLIGIDGTLSQKDKVSEQLARIIVQNSYTAKPIKNKVIIDSARLKSYASPFYDILISN